MAGFFLSYRRLDAPDIVGRLHDRVVFRFGAGSVFRDIDSIAVGADFRSHLQRALESCRALIAVIGRGFLDRAGVGGPDYMVEEIGAALERSLMIIPVLVHGSEMPEPARLPARIRDLAFRQAMRVRSDPDFTGDVEKLLRVLANHLDEARTGAADGVDTRTGERLRVTVHVGTFVKTNTVCCFINVTNLASSDVEVTHVWMESSPPTFPATDERPLPRRLKPQESWETWIPLGELVARIESEELYRLGRVRLSTGTVVSSVRNDSVPARGSVAGGAIRRIP